MNAETKRGATRWLIRPEPIELHSYVIVFLASLAGIAATLAWWQNADQTR